MASQSDSDSNESFVAPMPQFADEASSQVNVVRGVKRKLDPGTLSDVFDSHSDTLESQAATPSSFVVEPGRLIVSCPRLGELSQWAPCTG